MCPFELEKTLQKCGVTLSVFKHNFEYFPTYYRTQRDPFSFLEFIYFHDFKDVLQYCFHWSRTSEGYHFWLDIQNQRSTTLLENKDVPS